MMMQEVSANDTHADAQPRIACVHISNFRLQVLRSLHPEWATHPMAVVQSELPNAKVLACSKLALARGVRVGMRHSEAILLCPTLLAQAVSDPQCLDIQQTILARLRHFTPRLEVCLEYEGSFFLDPNGLLSLFSSYEDWAQGIQQALGELGFQSSIVVGFHKWRSFAASRGISTGRVFEHQDEEMQCIRALPLLRLSLSLEEQRDFEKLGLRTLGHLLDLPFEEVSVRYSSSKTLEGKKAKGKISEGARLGKRMANPGFSASISVWHRRLREENQAPVQAVPEPLRFQSEIFFEPAEDQMPRVLHELSEKMALLQNQMRDRWLAFSELRLLFVFEGKGRIARTSPLSQDHEEILRSAYPHRDLKVLLELLQLRLGKIQLPERVEKIEVEVIGLELQENQGSLVFALQKQKPFDLQSLQRGIARIRAAYGEDSVCQAEQTDHWLPEKQHRFIPWTPNIFRPNYFHPQESKTEGISFPIRRFWSFPQEHNACLETQTSSTQGPFRIECEWWGAKPISRDFFYRQNEVGEVFWYYREQGQWKEQAILM